MFTSSVPENHGTSGHRVPAPLACDNSFVPLNVTVAVIVFKESPTVNVSEVVRSEEGRYGFPPTPLPPPGIPSDVLFFNSLFIFPYGGP